MEIRIFHFNYAIISVMVKKACENRKKIDMWSVHIFTIFAAHENKYSYEFQNCEKCNIIAAKEWLCP